MKHKERRVPEIRVRPKGMGLGTYIVPRKENMKKETIEIIAWLTIAFGMYFAELVRMVLA